MRDLNLTHADTLPDTFQFSHVTRSTSNLSVRDAGPFRLGFPNLCLCFIGSVTLDWHRKSPLSLTPCVPQRKKKRELHVHHTRRLLSSFLIPCSPSGSPRGLCAWTWASAWAFTFHVSAIWKDGSGDLFVTRGLTRQTEETSGSSLTQLTHGI